MSSEKIILRLPSNMEDIELQQYQKYLKISKDLDTEDKEQSEFLAIKMLEIFGGITYDEVRLLPASVYEVALEQILKCLNEASPLVKRFSIVGTDGVEIEFGMIPNLDSMTLGEYIDLDNLISDWDNMHKMMAVLYRPVIKSRKDMYDIEPYKTYEKYEDIMKYTPLNVALGAMLFFYRLSSKLAKYILSSSLKQLTQEEAMLLERNLLVKSGVGIKQYMESLEVTSSNLTKLQVSQSISA